jgi:gamma-glutamyl hercynylcysteine S-oxide synthase
MSATATALAERLEATRARTRELLAPLSPEDLARQHSPILSPPLWDLGHIAAYEELWLVRRLTGAASLHPELEDVYDAFETPRSKRSEAPILGERAALRYLDEVRARALDVLAGADLSEDADPLTARGFVFDMVAQHEAQHTETVLQCLQMLPAGRYAPAGRRPLPAPAGPAGRWVEVPGGAFEMGARGAGFAYDCERPAHRREVAAFEMARDPVTCGEHLAFMADGGYARPQLWTAAGWEWREANAVEAPLYWKRDGEGGWLERRFDRREPVDPERALCHVSAHEADAHAAWAGARLPTEAEWELAAQGAPAAAGAANLDQLAFEPAARGAYDPAPSGCRGMIGDVWEWTSTAFDGYPGFRAFPYPEYAEVFFGARYRVLRGGSWATQPIAARISFRNWDLPERRQIFSGLRLARDLG